MEHSAVREVELSLASFPDACDGIERVDYISAVDGRRDWALLRRPSRPGRPWVVCIHGHGTHGDQLFTRPDLRERWLPAFLQRDLGILTPNLRDNAWMGPAAVQDLTALLDAVDDLAGAGPVLLASGSMGGSSNLIYAALHPERVQGVIARGAASDLASYHGYCRSNAVSIPVLAQIADAIEASYGGPPEVCPEAYSAHSALRLADRLLRMPLFLAHGSADPVIPVSQSRLLVGALAEAESLAYVEVPGGNHDSPLFVEVSPHPLDWLLERLSPG